MALPTPIARYGDKSANAPLKLSYDKGPTDTPLIEQTICELFEELVQTYPDREALVSVHQNRRFTFKELQAEANRLASAFIKSGLQKGDRIGIWSHNNYQWVVMLLACAKTGVILVNINPAYRLFELEYALNKVGCKAIVAMRRFKTSDYVGMLQELVPEAATQSSGSLKPEKVPMLERIVWFDEAGDTESFAGIDKFSDWIATGDADDPAVPERAATLDRHDPINIQFTSGTTGAPKGATLTHRNILNNGFFIGEAMYLTNEDRLCIPVPMYHCFGMVLGVLAIMTHGGCIVYPNDGFDPLTVLEAVQKEKCTGLHGVPTMFIAEFNHPRFKEFDLSSLRTGIMAGSSCPIEVMKRVNQEMHLDEITIAYGMTETSPVSCQSSPATPIDKRVSTVGLVQPHLEVKIVDVITGEIVPCGESGELCTKGYSVMQGYWGSEAQTKDTIRDGWMHTGDLATMDEDGYVKIVGRIKDMVIRGGENIYPTEIEGFLYRHESIQDVQIVGVPDAHFGEVLAAWIIVKEGHTLDEEGVREFCKGNIAHYKVPQYIRFVREFPMTVSGKIQKFKIAQAMKEELGLE